MPVTPPPQPGRDRPEWVVAINRNAWSQSIVIGGRNQPVRPINLQRFKELLNVFTQILTTADSTTVALPAGIPEPGTFPTDPEARAPAELAIFCSGWALLHEFKHIQHRQDGTSAPYEASADEVRSEEFSCDEFATEYILSTVSKYAAESSDPEDKVHFKRALGIYFALFTMTIIAKDRWSETDTHPSLQARISNIRKHMGPENLQLADAIAYAAFAALRVLWPNAPSPLSTNGQSPLP